MKSRCDTLAGTLSLGTLDPDRLAQHCHAMRDLGYTGVYFSDIFFLISPLDSNVAPDRILAREDRNLLVERPRSELEQVRRIVSDASLTIESSHFIQLLPPPGETLEWVRPIHERLIQAAAFMGMRYVTTHAGWMFGLASSAYLGQMAVDYLEGTVSQDELMVEGLRRYGGAAAVRAACILAYRQLCDAAAAHGITVTVEVTTTELPCVSQDVDALMAFMDEIERDNLGVCVDAGHCHRDGVDPAEVIRRLGPRMRETHFHDNFADRDWHNPIGIGTVNWLAVIQAMCEMGYEGRITFEQPDYAVNAQNWRLLQQAARGAEAPGIVH